MEQWNDQHQAELKADAPRGGYPYMGNGIYGMKLTYKDWLQFQLSQRAHKNYLEQITLLSFCMLVTGLNYAILAIVLGLIHFVARILFTVGYQKQPKLRMAGGLPCLLTTLILQITAMLTCILWTLKVFNKWG